MEYTKDLILNVHYDKVNTVRCFKTKNNIGRFWQKLKNHKLITTSVIIACTLMVVDGILIKNFVEILKMF